MKNFKRLTSVFGSLLILSAAAKAGDFSVLAIPTRIDTTAYGGVMVYGPFGNPAGCTTSNMFWIKETHPQFKQIYALILLATSSRQQISLYAHGCETVGWYTAPSVTYNTVTTGAVTLQP